MKPIETIHNFLKLQREYINLEAIFQPYTIEGDFQTATIGELVYELFWKNLPTFINYRCSNYYPINEQIDDAFETFIHEAESIGEGYQYIRTENSVFIFKPMEDEQYQYIELNKKENNL